MDWSNNAKLSFLEKQSFDTLEDLKNTADSILVTITDNTMYDSFQKNDTVKIKLTDKLPEEADCLIYNNDTKNFLFKHVLKENDHYIISQTFPEESVNKDNLEILGYATSILRV